MKHGKQVGAIALAALFAVGMAFTAPVTSALAETTTAEGDGEQESKITVTGTVTGDAIDKGTVEKLNDNAWRFKTGGIAKGPLTLTCNVEGQAASDKVTYSWIECDALGRPTSSASLSSTNTYKAFESTAFKECIYVCNVSVNDKEAGKYIFRFKPYYVQSDYAVTQAMSWTASTNTAAKKEAGSIPASTDYDTTEFFPAGYKGSVTFTVGDLPDDVDSSLLTWTTINEKTQVYNNLTGTYSKDNKTDTITIPFNTLDASYHVQLVIYSGETKGQYANFWIKVGESADSLTKAEIDTAASKGFTGSATSAMQLPFNSDQETVVTMAVKIKSGSAEGITYSWSGYKDNGTGMGAYFPVVENETAQTSTLTYTFKNATGNMRIQCDLHDSYGNWTDSVAFYFATQSPTVEPSTGGGESSDSSTATDSTTTDTTTPATEETTPGATEVATEKTTVVVSAEASADKPFLATTTSASGDSAASDVIIVPSGKTGSDGTKIDAGTKITVASETVDDVAAAAKTIAAPKAVQDSVETILKGETTEQKAQASSKGATFASSYTGKGKLLTFNVTDASGNAVHLKDAGTVVRIPWPTSEYKGNAAELWYIDDTTGSRSYIPGTYFQFDTSGNRYLVATVPHFSTYLALEKNVTAAATTVYRLYKPTTGEHLYTLDAHEVSVITTTQGWVDETASSEPMKALSKDAEAGVPVYRLYCPQLGQHLYTTDAYEKDVLKNSGEWNDEGIAFKTATKDAGTPVYRLNKIGIAIHHYTNQQHEVDVLTTTQGWKAEGVAFYSFK